MSNRLSYSAISTYQTCGQKYRLRYKSKLRSRYFHAPLAFGSAVDKALNKLLLTLDITQALGEFDKEWNFQWVNKKLVALAQYPDLVYAETDFDEELLHEDDLDKMDTEAAPFGIPALQLYADVLAAKKASGWPNVAEAQKKYYNYCNWLSMRRKGHVMLNSYAKDVLPQLNKVIAVQKENSLTNSEGDSVIQYWDLIAEFKDGRNIMFDNKTSAREYEEDSAGRSPQLISYYFGAKEEYDLKAVGFIVLYKNIIKNKIKICSKCNFNGSEGSHRSCPEMFKTGEIKRGKEAEARCGGEWNITLSPVCRTKIIINDVSPTAEDLVMSTFNEANEGIKKEHYPKNLSACKQGAITCEFYGKCWKGDESELIDVSKENE